ncbi:hypothetical protein ACHAXS_001917 [Conticribra weissflogii]
MKPLKPVIHSLLLGLAVANDDIQQEFQPPKLSFTFSSTGDIIVGANAAGNNNATAAPSPWTVFQGVTDDDETSAEAEAQSIRRRSGPLLALFPDAATSSDGVLSAAAHRANHVVATPPSQRDFLVTHGRECYDGGESIAARYDLLAASPSTSSLAQELWKYCALYVEGGVYVDRETAPLLALGDVLSWSSGDNDGGNGGAAIKNYAVLADDEHAGVSPSLFDEASSGDRGLKYSFNYRTNYNGNYHDFRGRGGDDIVLGKSIATGALLAIATKQHDVPKKMTQVLMTKTVEELERNALVLHRALKDFIREDMTNGNKWGFFRQRCQGIEVAGGAEHARLLRNCPASTGYCCEIIDPQRGFVFLLSRHSLLPNQYLPHHSTLPQPYQKSISSSKIAAYNNNMINNNNDNNNSDPETPLDPTTLLELPFQATIHHVDTHQVDMHFSPGSSETTPNAYEILHSLGALPTKQQCLDCLREKNGADCSRCSSHCSKFCENLCTIDVPPKPIKKVVAVQPPLYKKDPERIIPRIIHQTWFEPVTPEKYPNMSRLIESWKRSGWEYIFYDDASAAEFLSLHFPPEVREAYDSIIPGAFKADLFRYCVLLIKGGIYSDMDVMLESNLDAAVPPDVGFMTPVDAPGSKPDHRMCLWNGFIAAAPAHPFWARAIEVVVNNIRNRFTVVDYDRMMCPSPELSVPHAFSTLFTAGPCILGYTLNEVMGREVQTSFVEGDLEIPGGGRPEGVPGRTIILQQNKWDMGAHRFTWVENNLVVAATDMPDYDDRQELEGSDKEQTAHYSKTQTRTDLYGLEKLYVDRNIAHERIVIQTQTERNFASSME